MNKKMQSVEKTRNAVDWYQKNRDTYKRLALKVELIIKEILEDSGITFHSVTSRAKDIESFAEKAAKDKYTDPKSEILDLAGVRVTAYVESDVDKICEVIEREFSIMEEHSVNKSEILKYNEVGYRSVHYVASLNSNRVGLPEYRRLDQPFEIQVRTILQHAWAEIEHDRNYKFQGSELPIHAQIKRRFSLLAANLELIDKEFDAIVKDIDSYSNEVTESTRKGRLNIPIDSISLSNYLLNKLEPVSKNIFGELEMYSKSIVNELLNFGIKELSDLDKLINENNLMGKIKGYGKDGKYYLSINGILRLLMLLVDEEKYFKQCYKQDWKESIDSTYLKILEENGIDKSKLTEQLSLVN